MKKICKRVLSTILALMLLTLGSTTFFAETIYYYYGYHYTIINNDSVSLYGLDDDIHALEVPDTINSRAVVEIANYAFTDNEGLTSIDFSKATNLERIGTFTFKGCSNLSGEIIIPQSVNTIDSAAFQQCSSLEQVIINASITTIPQQCFYNCSSLNSVKLNENITEIGHFAFSNCKKLIYMEIPSSVTQIADTAFDVDTITLGVYTDSYAHQFAINNSIPFILLDAPVPTEPPTEPEPTEVPTEPELTETPTETVTETPTEMPTESAQTVSFLLGDVNDDGEVNIIDSTIIQRVLAKIIVDTDGMISLRGDIDDNGLSIDDVTLLGRYHAHIHVDYPINMIVNRKIK